MYCKHFDLQIRLKIAKYDAADCSKFKKHIEYVIMFTCDSYQSKAQKGSKQQLIHAEKVKKSENEKKRLLNKNCQEIVKLDSQCI